MLAFKNFTKYLIIIISFFTLIFSNELISQYDKYSTNIETFDQKDLFLNFRLETALIVPALEGAFFLVRHTYVLKKIKDDGKEYVRKGLPYFGQRYGIAIASGGQLYIETNVKEPWKSDEDFKKFSKEYVPVSKGLELRSIKEKEFKKFSFLKPSKYSSDRIENEISVFDLPDSILSISKTSDTLPSWGRLAILYYDTKNTIDSAEIYLNVTLRDINWDSSYIWTADDFLLRGREIIGGAFFKENITLGKVEWQLAGLLLKFSGKWKFFPIDKKLSPKIKPEKNEQDEIKKNLPELEAIIPNNK